MRSAAGHGAIVLQKHVNNVEMSNTSLKSLYFQPADFAVTHGIGSEYAMGGPRSSGRVHLEKRFVNILMCTLNAADKAFPAVPTMVYFATNFASAILPFMMILAVRTTLFASTPPPLVVGLALPRHFALAALVLAFVPVMILVPNCAAAGTATAIPFVSE